MNGRVAACLPLLACALMAQTAAPQKTAPPAKDPAADVARELQRFMKVFSTVETFSAEHPDSQKMIYSGAIPSMLRKLDPHTQFFEPSQFEQLKEMESSEQKGFGSIVSVMPGQVIFLQIFPGTPTSKAGIQPGDELLAINNVAIGRLNPDQIIGLLTQARQQEIMAFIRRPGDDHVIQADLKPEIQDAPTVDRSFLLAPGLAYVRVTSWDMQTARQLRDAIEKLNASPLSGLVLDLRNNPGGVVQSALEGASMFLSPGQRILTAKGRSGVVQSADVPKDAKPYTFKLAIIINGRTASASEILTGAVQDHDRGVIVGEPSYGKGLVQSVIPLPDNTGLALTTAFYYTPSGRSIQHPLHDSALSNTFGETPKAPEFKTDHGRTVLGGGGIRPDVEVGPADHTQLESVLDASGAITVFATDYLAHHSPLPRDFTVTPALLDDLKVFLASRNIQPGVSEWISEKTWITNRLLEEIVTQARGVAAGDEIAAKRDPQIQAAVQALSTGSL